MATDIVPQTPAVITLPGGLPALIEGAGDRAAWRFVVFFTATIRNANTREAYARIIVRFLSWFNLDNPVYHALPSLPFLQEFGRCRG